MKMTAMKYCLLILFANSLLFVVAWGVETADNRVASEQSNDSAVKYDLSK